MTRRLSPSLLFLAFLGLAPGLSAKDAALAPLEDWEADALVRAEAQAKAEREASRPDFQVLRETVVESQGQRTIYRRVVPPVSTPYTPSSPVPSTFAPEPADFEDTSAQFAQIQVLALSAMVYPDGVTRIDWRHEGMAYTAWSNIDFRYLRPVGHLTTPDQHFLVVLSIDEASSQHSPQPTLPSFTPGRAEYLILTDTTETALDPDAFTGLDALHAHYESNETTLKTQHQRNEALNSARQRHAASNPPTPQERVIHFWKK